MDRDKTMNETVEKTRAAARAPLSESEKYNEAEFREYRMKEKGLIHMEEEREEGVVKWVIKGSKPTLSGLRGMYRHRKHHQLRIVFKQMKHGQVRINRFHGPYQATPSERVPWLREEVSTDG